MKTALRGIAALAAVMATTAHAGEEDGSVRPAVPAEKPSWEFALTANPYIVRGGENYTSVVATADREYREGAKRGLHPPSALIATTSAVPSPAIRNPTFQLP